MGIALYIFGSALLLFHTVSHEKGKLMFVLLLVISYYYFTDNLGNTLCLFLNIPLFDFSYRATAVYLSCIAVTAYPLIRFMSWLWARICGLREMPWNRLCLVPLAFIVMGGVHWEFFLAGMITGPAFPVFEITIVVSAFIVYWQIADGLSKAADAVHLAERLRGTDKPTAAANRTAGGRHIPRGGNQANPPRYAPSFCHAGVYAGGKGQRACACVSAGIHRPRGRCGDALRLQNPVADAVCRRYIALAAQRNVQTHVVADIPEQPGVADGDLAVLLSNLWENALEACGQLWAGERYIWLRVKAAGNSLMVSMCQWRFKNVQKSRCKNEQKRHQELDLSNNVLLA